MVIVENVDRYCLSKGITVKEFERNCNLSNSAVHKWRTGIASPSLRTLQKISKATGIATERWLRERGV